MSQTQVKGLATMLMVIGIYLRHIMLGSEPSQALQIALSITGIASFLFVVTWTRKNR